MKNNKLNLLMITSLLIPFNVLAMNKTETIYENLNSNGERTNIVVSNHLSDIGDKNTINDNTILKDILNINGDEEYKLDGNNLTWNNNGKDIYYQGSTDEKSPITVKISYKLDDKDIDIKDLIGKSGNVKIKLDFENNSYDIVDLGSTNERIYTPFVTTVGTVIGDNATNVSITNGKAVSTGNRTIVVGIATPYLDKSLDISDLSDYNSIEISYDTDSFDLSDIYVVSTPKLLEDTDLSVFDKLDSAVSGINELSTGVSKLKAGASELSNGANTLATGASKLSTGINSAYEGSNKLTTGSSSLTSGLKSALDGAKNLADGSTEVDENLKQIIAGLNQSISVLNDKNKTLQEELTNLQTLENKNKEAIEKLSNGNKRIQAGVNEKLSNGNKRIQAGVNEKLSMLGGLDLSQSKETISATLDNYINDGKLTTDIKNTILGYKDSYDNNLNLITLISINEANLEKLSNTISSSLSEISTNLNTLDGYLKQLETTGTSEINSGANSLEAGIQKLYNGSVSLESGLNSLNDGLNIANSGASSLADGANTLATGASTLSNGIETLDSKGISKLRDLSSKISTYKNKAKAIVNSSKNYNGFTSDNSNDTTLISVIKNN